jgi:hypothetical protein
MLSKIVRSGYFIIHLVANGSSQALQNVVDWPVSAYLARQGELPVGSGEVCA